MKKNEELNYMFYPETFAVVGASDSIYNHGYIVITEMINGGYGGKIYPVNPEFDEILGFKCYPDIRDIPGDIDYVFVGIKAKHTPELMEGCAEKKVKICHFFASGFSELNSDEGKRLEKEVLETAKANNIRIVGPNSMGVYSPASGLYFAGGLDRDIGNFSLLSQSGGNLIYICRAAAARGIPVNKVVSYGNAADVNESDFLDYFADDDDTEIIGAYIEGVKDGRDFSDKLHKAASKKPTILFKAGKSGLGASTAASHTGALAGSAEVWDGVIKQTGAVRADSLDELIDLAALFSGMTPPAGRRGGIIGIGGGLSVLAADIFHNEKLQLPPLPEEVNDRLSQVISSAGSIFRNPVDIPVIVGKPGDFKKTVEIIAEWDDVDFFLFHHAYEIIGWSLDLFNDSGLGGMLADRLIEFAKGTGKPSAIILHYTVKPRAYEMMTRDREKCQDAGLPVFTSIESAAAAMNKFIAFHERKKKIKAS